MLPYLGYSYIDTISMSSVYRICLFAHDYKRWHVFARSIVQQKADSDSRLFSSSISQSFSIS